MLIEFSVENFRSFKNKTTLSMLASGDESSSELYKTQNNARVLPIAAIFGPNASGKSNLIKALEYFRQSVTNQNNLITPINKNILLQPFILNSTTAKKPSTFQVILWDEKSDAEYRYGFQVSDLRVESEWLEKTSKVSKNITSRLLFAREGKKFEIHESLKKSTDLLQEKVLDGALALNVFAQFAEANSLRVFDLLKNHTFIYDGIRELNTTAIDYAKGDPEFLKRLSKFMKQIDVPVGDLMITEKKPDAEALKMFPKAFQDLMLGGQAVAMDVETRHNVYKADGTPEDKQVVFSMSQNESLGTQKLFGFGAFILKALDVGGTVVIDEFGNSIHPFISREIIKVFRDKKYNKHNAQLILCSHDTYLLSNKGVGLRRDQIWFTEKDKLESTCLRSLTEYKTRKDFEVAKNYLEGRLGAVPVTWL